MKHKNYSQNMCGRTACALDSNIIQQATGVSQWVHKEKYHPKYNVGPFHWQPVIKQDDKQQLLLCSMRWGIYPPWHGNPQKPSTPIILNVRDDSLTIHNKPMFRKMKNHKRCIIVAQGFYEWVREAKSKIPYYVYPCPEVKKEQEHKQGSIDVPILYMAGLYTEMDVNGEEIEAYVIVTTENAPNLAFLHDRMPVFLEKDSLSWNQWLDGSLKWNEELGTFLLPKAQGLQWHMVSTLVNKMGQESSECIKEVKPQIPKITSFFGKKRKEPEGKMEQVKKEELDNPSPKK